MKNLFKLFIEKFAEKQQNPIKMTSKNNRKKRRIINFLTQADIQSWLDDLEVLPINQTVFFLGYQNKLKIAEIIGYSINLYSDFENELEAPMCKLIYKVVSRDKYFNELKEIDSDKAFASREELLMNLQADILEIEK